MCTIVSDNMLKAWTHTNIFNFQKNNQRLCPRTQNRESKKIKRPGQALKLQRNPVSTDKQAPEKVKWGPSPQQPGFSYTAPL